MTSELADSLQVAAGEYQEWFDSGFPPVTSPWESPDEYDLHRVRYAIKQTGTQFYPTLSTSIPSIREMYSFEEESANKKILSEEIEPYLDSLGQNAWTIFLSLLPNWQDTTDSLLQATTHLARDGYKK